MYRVTRQIDFCYGHRLLNYEGKCKHLHGHNGRALITIEAPKLDIRGMVIDFSEIKQVVNTWIDDNLDRAETLKGEADADAESYAKVLAEAREQSRGVISEVTRHASKNRPGATRRWSKD